MRLQLQNQIRHLCDTIARIIRISFYILLGSLILVDLTASGFRAVQNLFTVPQSNEILKFDSFSAPSVALATLDKQAKILLSDYTDARNSAVSEYSALGAQVEPAINPGRGGFSGFPRGSIVEMTRIKPIEELHALVQDLNLELEQQLLLIDYENHYENELINTFLSLLREAPESPEILSWVSIALDCSQRCSRTEEVQDALAHLLRYHPNLKTSAQITALKADWQRAHLAGFAGNSDGK